MVGVIPKGSKNVRYKNTLGGKIWFHPNDDCQPYLEARRERMKKINMEGNDEQISQ